MIPILWKILLRELFSIFLITLLAISSLILFSEFKMIHHTLTTGGSLLDISTILFYQVCYESSLLIALSIFIATSVTCYKLQSKHLFTTLAMLGIPFRKIATPLYYSALIITLLNFINTTTVAPYLKNRQQHILTKMIESSPLSIINNFFAFDQNNGIVIDSNNGKLSLAFIHPTSASLMLLNIDNIKPSLDGSITCKNINLISVSKDNILTKSHKDNIIPKEALSHLSTDPTEKNLTRTLPFTSLLKLTSAEGKIELAKRILRPILTLTLFFLGMCLGLQKRFYKQIITFTLAIVSVILLIALKHSPLPIIYSLVLLSTFYFSISIRIYCKQ